MAHNSIIYATIIIKDIRTPSILYQGTNGNDPQNTSGRGACLCGGDIYVGSRPYAKI